MSVNHRLLSGLSLTGRLVEKNGIKDCSGVLYLMETDLKTCRLELSYTPDEGHTPREDAREAPYKISIKEHPAFFMTDKAVACTRDGQQQKVTFRLKITYLSDCRGDEALQLTFLSRRMHAGSASFTMDFLDVKCVDITRNAILRAYRCSINSVDPVSVLIIGVQASGKTTLMTGKGSADSHAATRRADVQNYEDGCTIVDTPGFIINKAKLLEFPDLLGKVVLGCFRYDFPRSLSITEEGLPIEKLLESVRAVHRQQGRDAPKGPDAILIVCDCKTLSPILYQKARCGIAELTEVGSCLFKEDAKAPVFMVVTKGDEIVSLAIREQSKLPSTTADDKLPVLPFRVTEYTKEELKELEGVDAGECPCLRPDHPFYTAIADRVSRAGVEVIAVANLSGNHMATEKDSKLSYRFCFVLNDILSSMFSFLQANPLISRNNFLQNLKQCQQDAMEDSFAAEDYRREQENEFANLSPFEQQIRIASYRTNIDEDVIRTKLKEAPDPSKVINFLKTRCPEPFEGDDFDGLTTYKPPEGKELTLSMMFKDIRAGAASASAAAASIHKTIEVDEYVKELESAGELLAPVKEEPDVEDDDEEEDKPRRKRRKKPKTSGRGRGRTGS